MLIWTNSNNKEAKERKMKTAKETRKIERNIRDKWAREKKFPKISKEERKAYTKRSAKALTKKIKSTLNKRKKEFRDTLKKKVKKVKTPHLYRKRISVRLRRVE